MNEISMNNLIFHVIFHTIATRCEMTRLDRLKKKFRRGRPYRRAEVAAWSKSVDRDLQVMVKQGFLEKLSGVDVLPAQAISVW